MTEKPVPYHVDSVEGLILTIRNQKVILDTDLARVYGVPTKALNQAVKRNVDRFPSDFSFLLTLEEASRMRSHANGFYPLAIGTTNTCRSPGRLASGVCDLIRMKFLFQPRLFFLY